MNSRQAFALLALIAFCVCGTLTVADSPKSESERENTTIRAQSPRGATTKRSKDDDMGVITPGREAAALTFAERHHPDLVELLERLKRKNIRQYERALGQLFQSSEKLAKLEGNDPQRHALELEAWKLDSRIRLLAARTMMSESPAYEEELKGLVLERLEIRLRQLTLLRDRAQTRADRVSESIDAIVQDRESAAQKSLERIKRTLRSRSSKASKTGKQPSKKRKAVGRTARVQKTPGTQKSQKSDPAARDKQR